MAIEIPSSKPVSDSASTLNLRTSFNIGAKKISGKDRMFFTERLALLLETGGALQNSLETLKDQTDNPPLKAIISDLSDDVLAGRSFSQALSKHPQMFSSTYVNLIGASEHGGFMPNVLKELLKMEEKREKLRATIRSALAYPAFLTFFSVAVVLFILLVVFPKFGVLFESIRDQLPVTTIFLMITSDLLRQYWYAIFAVVLVSAILAYNFLKSPTGSETVDRFKLKLPFFRDIFIQIYLIQSLRVMSLSMTNGVSILDALSSCREVVDNLVFKRFISSTKKSVADGKGMAAGFSQGKFIPSMVRQMITTGEESGNLALVMDRIADFYERELESKLAMLTKIIEPLLLLIMGIVVGLIVSSLILPIFKLSRAVQ